MGLNLPQPIAAYYAAKNAHDIDAMLACFDERAAVTDEGMVHEGRAAIRAWMEDTTRRYRVSVAPECVERASDSVVVTALVSGNFPNSPAHLNYRFKLSNAAVSSLEIS